MSVLLRTLKRVSLTSSDLDEGRDSARTSGTSRRTSDTSDDGSTAVTAKETRSRSARGTYTSGTSGGTRGRTSTTSGTSNATTMKSFYSHAPAEVKNRRRRLLSQVISAGGGGFSDSTSVAFNPEVSALLTFDDNNELLRCVPLATVLRCGGRILSGSAGDAATYALSRPVHHIEAFISHNWAVPRKRKFLTLSMYYNFNKAALLTFVLVCLLGLGNASGMCPCIDLPGMGYSYGLLSTLLGIPVFILLMFFYHDFASLFGLVGPAVFLDKACIDQVDRGRQRRGIEKLGAFICKSDRMVVIYTDLYLRKLWTVYEVASFLSLHPVDKMEIVPVYQAVMFCVSLTILYLYTAATLISLHLFESNIVMQILALPLGIIYFFCVRMWARAWTANWSRLANFTVQDCSCFCEDDRPLVYKNVAALMRASEVVPRWAPDERALDAFDTLVRNELADAFSSAMGRRIFDLKHYIMLALSVSGVCTADFLCAYADGHSKRWMGVRFVHGLLWFGIWPVMLIYTEALAFCQLELQGSRELVFTIGVFGLFIWLPFAALYTGTSLWQEWCDKSKYGLALLTLATVAVGALLLALHQYRGGPGTCRGGSRVCCWPNFRKDADLYDDTEVDAETCVWVTQESATATGSVTAEGGVLSADGDLAADGRTSGGGDFETCVRFQVGRPRRAGAATARAGADAGAEPAAARADDGGLAGAGGTATAGDRANDGDRTDAGDPADDGNRTDAGESADDGGQADAGNDDRIAQHIGKCVEARAVVFPLKASL